MPIVFDYDDIRVRYHDLTDGWLPRSPEEEVPKYVVEPLEEALKKCPDDEINRALKEIIRKIQRDILKAI